MRLAAAGLLIIGCAFAGAAWLVRGLNRVLQPRQDRWQHTPYGDVAFIPDELPAAGHCVPAVNCGAAIHVGGAASLSEPPHSAENMP